MRRLSAGVVQGEDPLLPFGSDVASELNRIAAFANAPDLYVGSLVDPATDEVAAFEELVGSHGGLGGWQRDAVLVHPAGWTVTQDRLVGAEAVHDVLMRRLEELGHRRNLARATVS